MNIQIRLAQKKDYGQLSILLRQLNPSDPGFSDFEEQVFEEIIQSEHYHLVVAEDNDILIGSCYLNVIPNLTRGGRPYAVIENVIVDSQHRNHRVGQAVVTHAMEIAWENNCYKIMLMSGRKEDAVSSFYKKCGFDSNEKQAYIKRAK